MHSGQVKCSGSTMFLKRLYHVGYLLRLELTKQVEEDDLLNLVRKYVPNAFYENQQANEHFIRLTLNEDNLDRNLNLTIADLFDAFEERETKHKYGIQAYGLTNTSLEDVFIKIGTLDQPTEGAIEIETAEDHPLHNLERVQGFSLYLQQFLAILIKKFKLLIKNLQLFALSAYPLVLPTLTVIIYGLIIVNLSSSLIHIFEGNINSFDLKKNLGSTKVILLKDSSVDQNTDLFRTDNRDWLSEKFGFYFQEYDSANLTDVVLKEKERLGLNSFKKDVLLVSERIGPNDYKLHINPSKFPYSLVGTLESFYRTIARESDHKSDFNVNLNFKNDIGGKDQTEGEKTFKALFGYSILKQLFGFLAAMFISIMLSYPFVAFTELLNDEMTSGVSFIIIIIIIIIILTKSNPKFFYTGIRYADHCWSIKNALLDHKLSI